MNKVFNFIVKNKKDIIVILCIGFLLINHYTSDEALISLKIVIS